MSPPHIQHLMYHPEKCRAYLYQMIGLVILTIAMNLVQKVRITPLHLRDISPILNNLHHRHKQ